MLGRGARRSLLAIPARGLHRCAPALAAGSGHGVVGLVGAGNMGRGMAASLVRAGVACVQFDRDVAALRSSVEAANGQEGLVLMARNTASSSLQDLCDRVGDGMVIVSVAGEAAERAVFLGPGGLVDCARPGALLVGCGTVPVSLAKEVHAACACRKRGLLRFLDAPVSGGPEGAQRGTLAIMAGGSAADVVDAERLGLSALGPGVVHVGGPGCGAAAKLVNQQLVGCNMLAATEAMALALRLGLDEPLKMQTLLDLLGRSWGNSAMLQRTGALVLGAMAKASAASGDVGPGTLAYDAALKQALAVDSMAPLRNFSKDLDFVLAAAAATTTTVGEGAAGRQRRRGLELSATGAARRAVRRAEGLGVLSADWALLTCLHERSPVAAATAAAAAAAMATTAAAPPPFETLAALAASVPPALGPMEELSLRMKCAVLAGRRGCPIAVIDDDPTGTQTVCGVAAQAQWGASMPSPSSNVCVRMCV